MHVSILSYNISIYYIIYLSFEKKKTTCKVFEKIDFRLVARNFFQIQWKLNYPCFHCPNTILSPRYKLLYGYVLNDMAYSNKSILEFDYIVQDARMKMRLVL